MRRDRAQEGFTLVEMLIIMVIIAIMSIFAFAALDQLIVRNKLEGFAREASLLLYEARSMSIRRGVPAFVTAETDGGGIYRRLRSFIDLDEDGVFDEPEGIASLTLPSHVTLSSIEGFENTDERAMFLPNGSVEDSGGFIFEDEAGENRLMTRVWPAASANVELLKFHRDYADAPVPGAPNGFLEHSSEAPWQWY